MRALLFVLGLAALLVVALALLRGRRAGDGAVPAEGVLPNAPQRSVELAAEHPAKIERTLARSADPSDAEPAVAGTETKRATLRLDGRVVDPEGEPIEGAEVWLGSGRRIATSDENGAIAAEVVVADLEPTIGTDVVLGIEKLGYSHFHTQALPSAGVTVHLGTVVLERRGILTGLVLDARGDPVAEAEIVWRPSSDWPADAEQVRQDGFEWSFDAAVSAAVTDAGGRFELSVPLGEGFVSASAVGFLHSWSELFLAVHGQALERTLRLERSGRAPSILAGRVLAPDGMPFPAADVRILEELDLWPTELAALATDADGRFRAVLDEPGPFNVFARDPDAGVYPAELIGVPAGSQDLVLALGAPRWLTVVVTDPDGDPIPWSHARPSTTHRLEPAGKSGRARVLLPREPFEIEAFAPGFRTQEFGPFDPEHVGDELEVALSPGAAVRGRVTFEGRPVAGARIAVSSAFPPGKTRRSSDVAPYENRFDLIGASWLDTHDATTDRDGRFVASLHKGWRSVRVEAEGFPVAMRGPFDWAAGDGGDGLAIELSLAGAIEGRILVADGAELAGRVIGASSGWGIVWTAITTDEGCYRIDGLEPGSYQVRACVPPVASRQNVFPSTEEYEGLSVVWDCVVGAGATALCDVDLRDEGAFRLSGRLSVGSGRMDDWVASLLEDLGSTDLRKKVDTTTVAADGTFRLSLSRGGSYRLALVDSATYTSMYQKVHLARGQNDWELTVPFDGSLRVRNAGEGRYRLRISGSLAEDLALWHWITGFQSDEQVRLPPGRFRIERESDEDDVWPIWREVEIRSGEEMVVDYP